jgi:hypothetical protein
LANMRKRCVCMLLFLLFMHAVALNGLVPSAVSTGHVPGKTAVIIAFDVCGHHAPAGAAGVFDLTAYVPAGPDFVISASKEFPPIQDEAAPSASPRELEHPPKA